MSSVYVRQQIKSFLAAEAPSENVVDLTANFQEIQQLIIDSGFVPNAAWLGVEFIGGDEIPVELAATNDQGKYRETGAIFIHVVNVAQLGVGDGLLTRGETLRDLFRGRRIGSIIIDSVTPMNFERGSTLQFEGGYMSGSFIMSYQRDLDL